MRKFLKKVSVTLISSSLILGLLPIPQKQVVHAAETAATTYELEDGELTGDAKVLTDENGVGYVYITGTEDSVTVKVNAEEKGMYDLSISYMLPKAMGDSKTQYVLINDQMAGSINFTSTEEWRDLNVGTYLLNEGENTITIKAYWGWMYLDSVSVQKASIPDLVGNTDLCDEKATSSAQGLMNYLADMYGKHSLTGQQENCNTDREEEFNYISSITDGKAPAIRGFDYLNINPLFYYDDGTTDRIIDWVNEKGGIATVSYHWFAPADMSTYELGERVEWANSSFYTNGAGSVNTNFDVSKVSDTSSVEYQYIMLSLEKLAPELQKLQEADIPVLFRPLHEAGGSGTSDYSGEWFWWAAKGPEAYKHLWKLVYTTLTETYGLHNLIWEFNSYTYENSYDWYPGDEYVDIIAYDKYNAEGAPNESALSSTYYSLVKMYEGKKMVTMAECDTIPSVENIEAESAYWLYACPWYGEHIESSAKNNPDTINEIYNSELFITLDELPEYKTYEAKPIDPETTTEATTEAITTEELTTEIPTTETSASEESTTEAATTEKTTTQSTTTEAATTEKVTTQISTTETVTTEKATTQAPTTEQNTTQESTTETDKPHEHAYSSKVTKLPDCVTDGTMTFTCDCGNSYTEVIKAIGHSYEDTVVAPTEDTQGYTTHTCTLCGDTYNDSFIPALGHSNHTYTSKITKEATCTTDGKRIYTCECGESYTEVIKAAGHTYKDTVVAPTQTTQGYTEHTCSVCGDSYKDTFTTYDKPHTHAYSSTITKLPTCTLEGIITFTCSCGESYIESIPALGHSYTDTVIPPTETEAGYTQHTCSRCNDSYNDNFTPAIGHSDHTYTDKVTKEPTCTEDGIRTYTCSCGETYTETIKATGHTYQDEVIPPTEKEKGYTLHICTSCGDLYKDSYTPVIEHTHTHEYTCQRVSEPDCETNGVEVYTCTCGDFHTKNIAATGHNWKTTSVKATLTADGSTVKTCSICKKQEVISTVARIASVTLSDTTYTYNGKVRTPEVTVTDRNGNALTEGTDYKVTMAAGRINVGQYSVSVTFQGNYSGTYQTTFTICPKGTSLRTLKGARKSMKVTWKKQSKQISGYEIQYSTSKKFKNAKIKTVSKYKTTSKTLKKLSANKKYYVRIRTYKNVTINGKTTKLHSTWSKAKTVKTK